MSVLYSFFLPAYKARYLYESLKSILAQSYSNLELVIVDDCSPDDLKSIVDKFSDVRISYYRNETNIGRNNLVHQWNNCLKYANGDFVDNEVWQL